jgi:hypothetical protein
MPRLSVFALAALAAIVSLTIVTETFAASRGPSGVRSFSAAPRVGIAPRFSGVRTFGGVRSYGGIRTYGGPRRAGMWRGYPYRHGYHHRRFRFVGAYPYLGYHGAYYGGCYRWRTVWTAYGPQPVRVNVCYPYAYRYPFIY